MSVVSRVQSKTIHPRQMSRVVEKVSRGKLGRLPPECSFADGLAGMGTGTARMSLNGESQGSQIVQPREPTLYCLPRGPQSRQPFLRVGEIGLDAERLLIMANRLRHAARLL